MQYIILMLISIILSACANNVKNTIYSTQELDSPCNDDKPQPIYDIKNINTNEFEKTYLSHYKLLKPIYGTKNPNRYYNKLQKSDNYELKKTDIYHDAQKSVYDDTFLLRPRRCRTISEERYIEAVGANIRLKCN